MRGARFERRRFLEEEAARQLHAQGLREITGPHRRAMQEGPAVRPEQ